MNDIGIFLDDVIPNPVCELNYDKDYQLLIAVMLSAQTTDKRVNEVTKILFNKYSSLEMLSYADKSDIEDIIRPLGSFRKKTDYLIQISKILVSEYDSVVPKDRLLLEKLPGVGRKTVSVFLSEFYDENEFAVDTHVERVSKRLGISKEKDDVLKVEEKLKSFFPRTEWGRRHKQMVLFGRYYCKAIKPKCLNCNFKNICKYRKRT